MPDLILNEHLVEGTQHTVRHVNKATGDIADVRLVTRVRCVEMNKMKVDRSHGSVYILSNSGFTRKLEYIA